MYFVKETKKGKWKTSEPIPSILNKFNVILRFKKPKWKQNCTEGRAILEIEGSVRKIYIRALFPYKKLQEGRSDFSKPIFIALY